MRILHTADWQLGARFAQFGARAEALRAARLTTFRRMLELAREEAVDAFLVAGDLFEDNQVADVLVREVFELLSGFSGVPVYVLPGNHDPLSGPGCIWMRPPFSDPPDHVTVLTETKAYRFGEGWLVAAPVTRKKSSRDPTLKFAELVKGLEGDGPRIGIAHGSPAIESRHRPDDHPIALDAATRAGLDYLALGHWHGWRVFDGGRMVMPGTPEPDAFESEGSGHAALVEVSGGADRRAEASSVETATLRWVSLEADFVDWENARAALEGQLAPYREPGVAAKSVVRVALRGAPAADVHAEALAWLRGVLEPCLVHQIADRTRPALSEAEKEALRREHPLVAQVISDLEAAAALFSGPPPERAWEREGAVLSLKELESICGSRNLSAGEFNEDFFRVARELLYSELREAGS